MSHFSFHLAACVAASSLLAAPLLAAPADAPPPPAVMGLGVPVAPASLDNARGGSATMNANAALTGTVSGNSATQVVTGANSIQASSFAGATGIPIVIQNTGANVLIQNATVINLQFTQ
jgi:hypothetical protein